MKRDKNRKMALDSGITKDAYNSLVRNIADDCYSNGYNHVLEIAQKELTKDEYMRLKIALKNYEDN